MDRRKFLFGGAAAAASSAAAVVVPKTAAAAQNIRYYGGQDLAGWETVVGDGIYAKAGELPVSPGDLAIDHLGTNSTLHANVNRRGIMAHNITFKRIVDDLALQSAHRTSFEFRVPTLPAMGNSDTNAQTFEGGFFIWDGTGDRRDHGLGFQWVLNPWTENFGQLRRWSMSRAGWLPVAHMKPDTEWHTVVFDLDTRNRTATMQIDDIVLRKLYTRRTKPANWAAATASRLQAEIISLDPGPADRAPVHSAEVRNWHWTWLP